MSMNKIPRYEVALENDTLLKIPEFVNFCVKNAHNDIELDIINEGHCLQFCGVYDILEMFSFKSVTINTWNILESHPQYIINTSMWDCWLTRLKNFDFNYDYTWDKTKLFGCFYGRPSAPRLGIAGHLSKYHADKSIIKTKFDFSTEDTRKLFDLQRLFSWDSSAIDVVNEFQNTQYSTETYVKGHWSTNNPLSYLYKHFLIDLISEPTCQGNAFYPTEKVVRAMLCSRPFIAMCSKNYLIYLRQMGFKTFYDYWDEDYDGYNGKEKYFRILKLIDHIASLSFNELSEMYNDMQGILEHNQKLITTQTYSTEVRRVD